VAGIFGAQILKYLLSGVFSDIRRLAADVVLFLIMALGVNITHSGLQKVTFDYFLKL
jgi:hypothetical protein